MKKVLALFVALGMIAAFTACSEDDTNENNNPTNENNNSSNEGSDDEGDNNNDDDADVSGDDDADVSGDDDADVSGDDDADVSGDDDAYIGDDITEDDVLGTWNWEVMGVQSEGFEFNADGTGIWLGETVIEWAVQDGIIYICGTPEACPLPDCIMPMEAIILDGDTLILDMMGTIYTYVRG
ncbi:MAG: hypothetical protein FWF76_04700 [Oscillospiraceae bacterium]|nr:hypothetical protein [Oscillospiraceae bacterium]